MSKDIDQQIADLEDRIAAAKQNKLAALQAELADLEGTPATAPAAVSDAPRRGRPRKTVEEAAPAAPAKRGRKPGSGKATKSKRGGVRGPRIKDDDAIARLRAVVAAAGSEGISAKAASEQSGVFYIRAGKLMAKAFKKSGKGKWTRYSIK